MKYILVTGSRNSTLQVLTIGLLNTSFDSSGSAGSAPEVEVEVDRGDGGCGRSDLHGHPELASMTMATST